MGYICIMLKSIKYSFIAIATLAFVFSSCKKKDDPAPTNNAPTENVASCKINGQSWKSFPVGLTVKNGDSTYGSVAQFEADTLSMSLIGLNGSDTSFFSIAATVNSGRIGTYTDDAYVLYFPKMDFATVINILSQYEVKSPKLTITKYDPAKKLISGTYSVSLTSSSLTPNYEITEGVFNDVPYTIK